MIDPVIRERLALVERRIDFFHAGLDDIDGVAHAASVLRDLYAIRDAIQRELPPPLPAPPVDIEEVAIAVWHRLNAAYSTAVADAGADAVRRCLSLAVAAPAQPGGSTA